MKLALYSLNYSPELTGIGKYNGEMCTYLVQDKVDVSAIVAPPYYPEWEVHTGFSNYKFTASLDKGVKVIRCPIYVPKKVTTIRRFIHLSSFAVTSGLSLFSRIFNKPDVIMLVQPTLFCAPLTLLYAKITGTKTIMHIQDFEVDAMFGLGMMSEGRVARVARKVESWLLSKFDVVSTISYSMMENAKSKGVREEQLLFFPNWADVNFVNPDTCGNKLKAEWGYNAEDKVVLYAGNIGKKQGLEIVLEAAKHFKDKSDIKFVFVGSGAYVDELKLMCNQIGIDNVEFKPLQPWERVPEMLAMADVHLVVQKKGAADAVLPSKLTNILSAGGHALVTAESHTELGKLAEKHSGIYKLVEPESSIAFVSGLEELLASDLTERNHVARQYAEKYLDKSVILNRFHQDLQKLVAGENLANQNG